ncbi:MAG TPA: isoprenylcysteine carboxylmethyltransferase family protein [Terriglobales bacterium]|nr:isoprenylcysteine carboxylmethyltransferase family protein [Terriglobales bacterium]
MLARRFISAVAMILAMCGAFLFLPAWTLRWWRAWTFIGVMVAAWTVTMFAVFARRPDLLNERFKTRFPKDQPLADKIAVVLLIASYYGLMSFIPVDVFHLHLLPRPAIAVSSLGLLLFVAGWTLISLAFRENSFAVPAVRLQTERGQTVVDSGVYRIVRHPLYAGSVLLIAGMPLWLESYAATVLALVPVAILIVRILGEEKFLRRELTGYAAYTQRVRYRLVPFVW